MHRRDAASWQPRLRYHCIVRLRFPSSPSLRRVHLLLYVSFLYHASQMSFSVKRWYVLRYYVRHLVELSDCLVAGQSILPNLAIQRPVDCVANARIN